MLFWESRPPLPTQGLVAASLTLIAVENIICCLLGLCCRDDDQPLVVEVTGGRVAATALELGPMPGQFTTLPVTPLE